ncbi:MAG: YhbY family RNA-binding protein [Oscillospiraceae bacterium]|nr:YhbY family RNA-binding protein [Oscillospiraceae bacterium]
MELTGKQRAQLRGMANGLGTILHVGKDGIGENLLRQADSALEARELIKGRVLENSMLSSRQAAQAVAEATGAAVVQVIGTRFVLYRPSRKKDRADRIILVQSKEK